MKAESARLDRRADAVTVPPIAKNQLRWFQTYIRFYLKRNFRGLHLMQLAELRRLDSVPLLLCLNHPSWWDPLIALFLSQSLFKDRQHYGPIAAEGMAKYKLFERFGFFSLDRSTRAGASRFLKLGEIILSQPSRALWVTPQGAFTDVRCRPISIEPGVGHLARRSKGFAMLPVALEYAFWNERFPEAFICTGQPITVASGRDHSAAEWNQLFADALAGTQDALAQRVQQRNPTLFEPLLTGRAGVGGVYDLWRALKARLQGKPWQPEHESR